MTRSWNETARALAMLAAGGVGLAFGQGHWPSGMMAVAGVVCMARFVHTTPGPVALLGFVVTHVVVWEVAYRGMVPLPTAARLGMESGVSLVLGLVFLLDRWGARRSTS